MKLSRSEKVSTSTALATAGVSALVALASGKGAAALGPVGLAMLTSYVRLRWSVSFSQKRAQRLLEAARRNPELSFEDIMIAERIFPDPELVETEVRARLRDIAEALDPETVEPLYRVIQERLGGRLTRQQATGAATLLRALSAGELGDLRILLSEALAAFDAPVLELVSRVEAEGDQKPFRTVVRVDKATRDVTLCRSSKRLFRLLREADLAADMAIHAAAVAFINDGTDDPQPQEAIIMRRASASAVLQLLGPRS